MLLSAADRRQDLLPIAGLPKLQNIELTINGKAITGSVESRTLLVDFLREQRRLTGTHIGCDTSQCGACVVHINGESVKSCTLLAVQADGADVTTIEGIADGETLHLSLIHI